MASKKIIYKFTDLPGLTLDRFDFANFVAVKKQIEKNRPGEKITTSFVIKVALLWATDAMETAQKISETKL